MRKIKNFQNSIYLEPKTPKNFYWSNAFIAIAQVFAGVAAGTFFTGNIDLSKILVVLFNLIVAGVIFYFGWRLSK